MRGQAIVLVTILAAAALAGCSTAGNEVMIFATDTKVAIDISADPTGQPNLTIGYKRREGVWLPLSARDIAASPTHTCRPTSTTKLDCKPIELSDIGTHVCRATDQEGNALFGSQKLNCQSLGDVRRHSYEGRGGADARDSYSVMASFGLKATTTGGAEIAQYFATGLAARALATQGGAALVNTQAVSPEVQQAALEMKTNKEAAIKKIADFVYNGGSFSDTNLTTAVEGSEITATNKKLLKELKNLPREEFERRLSDEFSSVLSIVARGVDKAKGGS